jgi:hypothetical protein
MDEREMREILGRVARGELDADEAARLLDGRPPSDDDAATTPMGNDDPTQRWWGDDETEGAATEPEPGPVATGLRVAGPARKVRVVGDPSVREVLVRGANVRREDDLLVVDFAPDDWSTEEPWARGFAILGAGHWGFEGEKHWHRNRERWERMERRGRRAQEFASGVGLVEIRANPRLDLTLDMAAGAARVSRMEGKITASATAGSIVLTDVLGPVDASVTAGSLTITGPISRGDSRISCDMGSVRIRLEPGANVRFKIDTLLGKGDVRLGGITDRTERGEWVVGDGAANLAITSNMGTIKVRGDV